MVSCIKFYLFENRLFTINNTTRFEKRCISFSIGSPQILKKQMMLSNFEMSKEKVTDDTF